MALGREVRVGAFVLAGLAVAGAIIFMIGDSRRMFDTKQTIVARFEDVEGLKPGSPVRMGGVDIGSVSVVAYPEDETQSDISVQMQIVATEAKRIRGDSVASIAPKGMLGDKLIVVTKGSLDRPIVEPGGQIKSGKPDGLFAQVGDIGQKAGALLTNLEKTTSTLASDEFQGDMQGSASSLRGVLKNLENGEGFIPRLLKDKTEADRLSKAVENLERTSAKLNRVLGQMDQALARVNRGPGLVHQLIYSEDGSHAASNIGAAAEQLALAVKEVREGDGLAHNILFGGESKQTDQAAGDLVAITNDLRTIVRGLREGKGTLGALIADPSVYEDLKVLLGNVQRNEVLRALVRYSIKRDEAAPAVPVDKQTAAARVQK